MIFGKTINKYYAKYFYLFLVGVIALIFVDLFQLEIPRLTQRLIDGLDTGVFVQEDIVELVRSLAGIAIVIVLGRFFWRIGIIGASRRIDYDLRNEMFAHAEKLSHRFYSDRKVGGLMAHFINDLEAVRRAIGPGLIMFVDAVFLGILVLIRMYTLSPSMTMIVVIPLSAIALAGSILGNRMRRSFKDAQKAFEDLSDFTQESFSGISVIKAFVKERLEIKEFLKANKNAKEKNIRFVKISAVLQIFVQTVVSLVFVLIIILGANVIESTRFTDDPFTIGQLVEFSSYFGMLIWPMMAVTMIINVRSQGKASLERIEKILNEPIDIVDENVISDHVIGGKITFNHLDFRYPDGEDNVLTDISFTIEQGETVGILGRTGSGKTSIVDLLLRIYNVNEGELLIDDIDIMRLPFKQVREAVGYVPQDGFLFSDTIRNNIAFGVEQAHAQMDTIENVAKLSDVHHNISEFKRGYDTIVGERGVTLSGGQKQRVSIARALAKDPAILILDDSVSAVDTDTEEKILRNLKTTRQGKTTIMIAHRISTVKNADKIVLIDEGRVVDVGTHEELLIRSELYADMVRKQDLQAEVEGE